MAYYVIISYIGLFKVACDKSLYLIKPIIINKRQATFHVYSCWVRPKGVSGHLCLSDLPVLQLGTNQVHSPFRTLICLEPGSQIPTHSVLDPASCWDWFVVGNKIPLGMKTAPITMTVNKLPINYLFVYNYIF